MTTITQYYADINAKNYQAAYSLWVAAYQQSTSYQKFASGFATTQNDVVQVNAATALLNGTVKVPLTIHSVNTSSSGGTVQHTYQGYYTAGIEVDSWHLLSASIQQTN